MPGWSRMGRRESPRPWPLAGSCLRKPPRAERGAASRLVARDGPHLGLRDAQVVGGREDELRAAHARGHGDGVEQLDRLVHEHRVVLLAADGRAAPPDLARGWLQFLYPQL